MKVYFDMCSLQRPLDDKSQLRVQMESEAVLAVLALCESGKANLVASDALLFETEGNPDTVRRDFAIQTLGKAAQYVGADPQVRIRSQMFVAAGIKPLDALHLASAVEGRVEYFCTCDDRFLRKARSLDTSPTKVVSPLELVSEINL